MSTTYCVLGFVRFEDVFNGALEPYGVKEHINVDSTAWSRCLTDGESNFLWVYQTEDGATVFKRYYQSGPPTKMLDAIAQAFGVEIVSEYEPQFWGFMSREEWYAEKDEIAAKDRDELYARMMRFVHGDDRRLVSDTNQMRMTGIVKRLIADQPDLARVQWKEKVLAAGFEANENMSLTDVDTGIATIFACDPRHLPKG